MKKHLKNLIILSLVLLSFCFLFTGCFLFDDTDPADKANIEQITTKVYTGKSEAKETNKIIKQVGFSTISDISFGWEESGMPVYLFVCDDIVVDIGIIEGVVKFIEVNDNGQTPTILRLYDVNSGGYIKSISQAEKTEVLAKQTSAANTAIENYVSSLISLEKFVRTSPNSAGGVDVKVTFKNNSPKTIKYIYMSFRAWNAVGDEVYCSIRGAGVRTMGMTGPIEQGDTKDGHADCYWYNTTIASISFNYFQIEYMDGTTIEFGAKMINALIRQRK